MASARSVRFVAGLLASMFVLTACGPRPVSTIATIHFENATPEQMTQAANILKERFSRLEYSFGSTITATVQDQRVVLEFRGAAPTDDMIREHATQGVFRISPVDTPLLFLVTDLDIENVNAREDPSAQDDANGFVLDLQVSERAGQRLLNHTSRNLGRVLITSWNGKEQSRAVISGVFSTRFQTSGLDRNTAGRMMVMLKSGRLPIAPEKIEIVRPSPGPS